MLGFRKVEGAACPRCGCRDSEAVGAPRAGRRRAARTLAEADGLRELSAVMGTGTLRRCSYCGAEFSGGADGTDGTDRKEGGADKRGKGRVPVVVEGVTACPHCGGTRTRVRSTRGRRRQRKCLDCRGTFVSVSE